MNQAECEARYNATGSRGNEAAGGAGKSWKNVPAELWAERVALGAAGEAFGKWKKTGCDSGDNSIFALQAVRKWDAKKADRIYRDAYKLQLSLHKRGKAPRRSFDKLAVAVEPDGRADPDQWWVDHFARLVGKSCRDFDRFKLHCVDCEHFARCDFGMDNPEKEKAFAKGDAAGMDLWADRQPRRLNVKTGKFDTLITNCPAGDYRLPTLAEMENKPGRKAVLLLAKQLARRVLSEPVVWLGQVSEKPDARGLTRLERAWRPIAKRIQRLLRGREGRFAGARRKRPAPGRFGEGGFVDEIISTVYAEFGADPFRFARYWGYWENRARELVKPDGLEKPRDDDKRTDCFDRKRARLTFADPDTLPSLDVRVKNAPTPTNIYSLLVERLAEIHHCEPDNVPQEKIDRAISRIERLPKGGTEKQALSYQPSSAAEAYAGAAEVESEQRAVLARLFPLPAGPAAKA